MKTYKWRTIIAGAIYVDGMTGSDVFGDGTMQNPYNTLRRAWGFETTGKPSTIVCRGRFTEDMADGNHAATIRGDYLGAATFDGMDNYLIYGFTLIDIIVTNCIEGNTFLSVWSGSGLFAGAGRATAAHLVGSAFNVLGVAGSPVVLDRTGVYWGVLGGTSAVSNNVFSRIKNNATHLVSLGGRDGQVMQNNTFYSCKISNRKKKVTSGTQTYKNCLFANFDIIIDEASLVYEDCLFLADCDFYFGSEKLSITGANSEDRHQSLISELGRLEVNSPSVFTQCVFSPQNSAEVLNNPEHRDWTLKHDSDAVKEDGTYFGAMPPALSVPIVDNSDGVVGSWDSRSAAGCLTVYNNSIAFDQSSASGNGMLLTKIIQVDVTKFNVSGLFADFLNRFSSFALYLWGNDLIGERYNPGDTLPLGRYIVKGDVDYLGDGFSNHDIVVVSVGSTTFSSVSGYLLSLNDENISNVLYFRDRSMVTARIEALDGLEEGATYLNDGAESIIYRGRTIVPGESFVAENSVDTFSATAGYKLAVLFDDSRVSVSEWIPAQMYGEYFCSKVGGVVQRDVDGVPISSGNYLSFTSMADGGHMEQLYKVRGIKRYIQLKAEIRQHD